MECCNPQDRVKHLSRNEFKEHMMKDSYEGVDSVRDKLLALATEASEKAQKIMSFVESHMESMKNGGASDICEHQMAKQLEPLVDLCLKTLLITRDIYTLSEINIVVNDKMLAVLNNISKLSDASGVSQDLIEGLRIKPKKKGWFN